MHLIGTDAFSATVTLSVDELRLINNALNEVCNGVHFADSEFETRLGAPRDKGRQILAQISELLRSF